MVQFRINLQKQDCMAHSPIPLQYLIMSLSSFKLDHSFQLTKMLESSSRRLHHVTTHHPSFSIDQVLILLNSHTAVMYPRMELNCLFVVNLRNLTSKAHFKVIGQGKSLREENIVKRSPRDIQIFCVRSTMPKSVAYLH